MNMSIVSMLVGGLVRMLQGLAASAPTLLVGLLIAAILRYYLGHAGTRKFFGGDSLRSLPQSWLIGMLLPVCSIGVLPILIQMRRSGVKPGALSAFALSAPLFNPLSLLYGLTLSRPLVIIMFAIGSLLVVTILGLFWDAFDRRKQLFESEDMSEKLIGFRRILAIFVSYARDLTGASFGLALLGLSGLALIAFVLPFGAMQHAVERDDWWAPVKMMLVAVPAYATPMLAMSQLGMMFQHANSPGASFTLLILGAGMNVATPIWFGRHFGYKAATLWFLSLIVVVLGISYAVNRPLIAPGVEPAGHTHAFDIYTNPVSQMNTLTVSTVGDLVAKDLDIGTIIALGLLAVIAVIGLLLRAFGIDEAWLVSRAPDHAKAKSIESLDAARERGWDVIVPSSVIGGTLLIGLVAFSVVACFGYYPPPKETLDEIAVARAEALSAANSGQVDHALYWLPIWEDWSRRLEVGTFLRTGRLRPYQRMQGYIIRKKLELLEHELEHDPFEIDETRKVVRSLLNSNTRWVNAFRDTN